VRVPARSSTLDVHSGPSSVDLWRWRRPVRLAALAALAALALAAPYLAGAYALNLLARAGALGLLAVSVAVLAGHAGLPTLGQVAPCAVGAYGTAWLAQAGVTTGVLQLAAATLAGAVFSALTAPVVVRGRGVTVLMVTLAIEELTSTVATRWRGVTGGSDGTFVPAPVPVWGLPPLADDGQTYRYVLVVVVLAVLVTAALLRGSPGRLLRATRDNETRMRASGHPVTRYLAVAYTGAGALAGLAGALLATAQGYLSPGDVGFTTAALVLLAVAIGGASSLAGAVAGAALIVAARDWLAGPWPGHAPLLLGGVFIAAVYLLPRGLAGLRLPVPAWWRREPGPPVVPAGPPPVVPAPGRPGGIPRPRTPLPAETGEPR